MENNENEYYVINVKNRRRMSVIVIAKYNKEHRCFYDYHREKFYDLNSMPNLQIGQKITLEAGEISISDENISKEICQVVEENNIRKEELQQKHPDLYPQYQTTPSTHSISENYFTQRKSQGKDVNPYIVGIVDLLSEAMGLKVRRKHGGKMYDQLGFDYPEEVEDVLGSMYDIVDEYLENLEDNEVKMFNLCEFGKKGKEYDDFTKEIERRTGYNHNAITSDLEMQQHSEHYHGENLGFSDRYASLMKKKPTFYISKKETTYAYDRSESTACRKTITPQLCVEKYKQYKTPLQQRETELSALEAEAVRDTAELKEFESKEGQNIGE